MATGERPRLIVLFGGRSAEHEVSCVSALHVLRAVDTTRYDLAAIGITRDGRWVPTDVGPALGSGAAALPSPDDAPGGDVTPTAALLPEGARPGRVVVFPLLHGPMGEDGTVQGLLELAGVAYIGAGVAGSSVCMDKALSKRVLEASGLPVVRWLGARDADAGADFVARVGDELGFPVFVKPANMGSSVGVSKAGDPAALGDALDVAFRYDEYAVVEEAVTAREIEVGVLGNARLRASVPGEVVPTHEFYDFADKYLDGKAGLVVPASLDGTDGETARSLALDACRALRVDGMARVDFLFEEGGRGFLLNEVNTIPGFTPGSMFPKLWQASGLAYDALIDELVSLAVDRQRRRARFDTAR